MMTQKNRLLIVEDEAAIRTGLVDVFIFHGFDVEWADNGLRGLEMAHSGRFHLILLDVMLPGMNGFEVCDKIRVVDKEQPIIMLTAKGNDEDIIKGLTLGADDYVTKPFSIAQLVLRVQAVLRRAYNNSEQHTQITLDQIFTIDILNLKGNREEIEILFTRREMEIIQYLYAHAERPVTREELLNKVWGYSKDMNIETRTVDIHIAKLRRKLEIDPTKPRYLVTVRGAGYRLMVD
jgi:two-component system response regulator RegX3